MSSAVWSEWAEAGLPDRLALMKGYNSVLMLGIKHELCEIVLRFLSLLLQELPEFDKSKLTGVS
ncbi:hypothetical protein J6590_072909 [Homalodisca vitripennis]|nr:hypothetical protein J6590_072909 [Homalodisca vitripennis]